MTQSTDSAQNNGPKVVVTLKPIHSLVAQVMAGTTSPALLLTGGASPHDYALKPSQARLLENADLLIWVGPEMEVFLAPFAESRQEDQTSLALLHLADISQQKYRPLNGDHIEGTKHGEQRNIDPHFWLSINNAKAVVKAVQQALSTLAPHNTDLYKTNAAVAIDTLDMLDAELTAQLNSVKMHPFLVYHDATQYFESTYDLNGQGAMTLHPEIPISAKRLSQIHKIIREKNIFCVFSEAPYQPKLITRLKEEFSVKGVMLDPLGSTIPAGPKAYGKIMHTLGQRFSTCLTP